MNLFVLGAIGKHLLDIGLVCTSFIGSKMPSMLAGSRAFIRVKNWRNVGISDSTSLGISASFRARVAKSPSI